MSSKSLGLGLVVAILLLPFAGQVLASANSLRVDGGTERVLVPNAAALNPSGAITIEAWVRLNTTSGCQTIVGKNFTTGYWLGLCEGRIRYYTSGLGSNMDGSAVATVGEWTHVAVTFDGTTRRYYMNGVLDLTATSASALPVNLDALGFGGEATSTCGNTCPLNGFISEVRLWSIARNEDDIRRDIVRQIENAREGLVAAWHLEGNALEAFGNHDGAPDGGATFTGIKAPPVGEDPLRIPRILTPTLDGVCSGPNGPLRIPVWDDTQFVEWVYLGATATDLWVCVEDMPRIGGFVAVYVDPDNSASAFANPDDFRLRLPEAGLLVSEAGTGSGGYSGPGPGGSAAAQTLDEFKWRAEFRIPRSELELGPDGSFRLQVIHDRDGGASLLGDWGWPVGFYWDWPFFYEPVIIDDSIVPPPDHSNPTVIAWHDPEGAVFDLNATATDDGGVATMTLFVDFIPELTCNFEPGEASLCRLQDYSLTPGRHHFYAEATDFAGRPGRSEIDSFQVSIDGRVPELAVIADPFTAPLGGSTMITATATDPSGIDIIDIGPQRCNFTGLNTVESCTFEIASTPGEHVREIFVRAIDAEGLTASLTRRVLFGNDGPDSDGDGLSDDVESVLCTSPNRLDTDGDALSDKIEVLGLLFAGSGKFVDLPSMGANPCYRDVFLQYDYEEGARVEPGVVDSIVAAFRRNGIVLHVEENERPRPAGNPVSTLGSAEGAVRLDENGEYYFPPELNYTHYYAYGHHEVGVSGAFYRYFEFQIYNSGSACVCPFDGIDPATCGLPEEEIDTGCTRESADGQTRRFMHELGHTLGLGHGGRTGTSPFPTLIGDYVLYPGVYDNDNYKPNYRSVMNYGYNGNVCVDPETRGLVASYDYSSEVLGDITENALDERSTSSLAISLGFATCPMGRDGVRPLIVHSCADPDENPNLDIDLGARRTMMYNSVERPYWRLMHGSEWANSGWNPDTPAGLDWNCDGVIEASVAENVNNAWVPPADEICGDGIDTNGDGRDDDEFCGWTISGTPFRDHVDWFDLPRPPACIVPFVGGPEEDTICYAHPEDYRNRMELPDASLICDTNGLPIVECPALPRSRRDVSVLLRRGSANRGGQSVEPVVVELDYETRLPPDTEGCDGRDNDGDLLIDEGCRDTDLDGLADALDNCPDIVNPDQADLDGDALGDSCDALVLGPVDISENGNDMVILNWDEVPGAIGYNVYRSDNGSSFAYLGGDVYPVVQDSLLQDDLPVEGVSWSYRVYPVNANGEEGEMAEGEFSNDNDADGVADMSDNCLQLANPGQEDSDADNIGNACDPDIAPLQNDCIVNFLDLNAMSAAFFSNPLQPSWNPDADFNGDGFVNFLDLATMQEFFFTAPGPSGLPSGCN